MSTSFLLQQGHKFLEQGQYKEALNCFERAKQLESNHREVLYGLGLA